jgi:hypothetical protein
MTTDKKTFEDGIAYAVAMCKEMAERYDWDIEGCSGEELTRYSEGIECSLRLAYWIGSLRPLQPLVPNNQLRLPLALIP